MCKTGSLLRWPHSPWVRWILCLLVGCLAAHFLVEDALLLHAVNTRAAARSSASFLDEATHQDDLAVPFSIPQRTGHNVIPAVFTAVSWFKLQLSYPPLPPPKLA